MLFGCLDIRWNTPSRVWCITSPCLEIRWNTPSGVSYTTSLCSEIRWNTCVYSWVLCIVFVSLCKGNRRSNFESLSSHLSKYEDSIPLADRNRNNLLALARMNNYLYGAWCHIVNFSNCNLFPTKILGILVRTHFNVHVRSRSTGIWKCCTWAEGKTGSPGEKPLGARKTDQKQTEPTNGVDASISTWTTLVGGECSDHCATLASSHWHEGNRFAFLWRGGGGGD